MRISKTIVLVVGMFFMFSCLKNAFAEGEKVAETSKAEFVGMETCANCHEDVVKEYVLNSHSGGQLKENEEIIGETCEACHGPGSEHVNNDGDTKKIIRYSEEKCFSCHIGKRAQFNLQYHHPVPEGRMSCLDCHDIHNAELKGISLDRQDEKCFECHKELKGPFVFEHDAMREGCQVCHEPHGTPYDKLLIAGQTSICVRCHWEIGTNSVSAQFGGVNHNAYNIGRGEECIDHHRAPHGSNIWRTFNR